MDEIRNCPFCNAHFDPNGFGVCYSEEDGYFVKEKTDNVSCNCLPLESFIPIETWQTRPIEDALNAEIVKLRAKVAAEREKNRLRPIVEIPEINKTILLKKIGGEYITGKMQSMDDVDNNGIPKFVIFETSTTVFYESRDEIIGWMPLPSPPEQEVEA